MKNRESAIKIIEKLSKSEQLALAKEIARICEKQYRKGYQHGVCDCVNGDTDDAKAQKFRTKGMLDNYTKIVSPLDFSAKTERFDIIKSELSMSDMEILSILYLIN